jgi:predicted nicotinamide N-methyase
VSDPPAPSPEPSPAITDRRAFILANTRRSAPPHVPEIELLLASEAVPLWLATEEELGRQGLPPPFWAFAWAGGQALARYVLDHPDVVRGRAVLDLATGSGLVGIAAALAGAAAVRGADIDLFALEAARLNAAQAGVALVLTGDDLIGQSVTEEVILVGDLFYERDLADRLLAWLLAQAAAGKTVLVGDPGRSYLPRAHLFELACYEVAVSRELEDSEVKRTRVWSLSAPASAPAHAPGTGPATAISAG